MAVVGVDIGGTSIRVGYFSKPGQMQTQAHIPTHQWGWPLRLEPLAALLRERIAGWEAQYEPVDAVGLAAAAVVEPESGFVRVGENLGWKDLPVGAILAHELERPVRIDVDAFCGALAEGAVGSGKGLASFLYVVVGTGIGHGLVLNGSLRHGMHGAANAFGHIKVVPNGAPCYCGGAGCLCQYASGPALLRLARGLSGRQDLEAEELVQGSVDGKEWAMQAVDAWTQWMALALANALTLLDLETAILGGGVIRPSFPDLAQLSEKVAALVYPEIRPVEVRRAALGDESVLIGAAELAFRLLEDTSLWKAQ